MSIEAPIQGLGFRLGAEIAVNTPVAGANDTVIGANTFRGTAFIMPSTAAVYMFSAIEWLNGTVVNGNTNAAIWQVDANPPSGANVVLLGWAQQVAQTGDSAVQKNSFVSHTFIKGGTICMAFISTASATGRYGTTTVASANNSKSVSSSADYTIGNTTAWAATTEEPYIKVYAKPVL